MKLSITELAEVAEVVAAVGVVISLIYLYQNVLYQIRKGVVDTEPWEAWLASLDEFLAYRGFRDVLDEARPHLAEPFNELVNARFNAVAQSRLQRISSIPGAMTKCGRPSIERSYQS